MRTQVDDTRLALTVREAARRLGLSERTIRAAIKRGDFRGVKIGKHYLIPVADLLQKIAP